MFLWVVLRQSAPDPPICLLGVSELARGVLTRKNYMVVNTQPKCFAFFQPNSFLELHLLCTFQPEMYLRTWKRRVRFSSKLYFRLFLCNVLMCTHRNPQSCCGQYWYERIGNFCSFLLMVFSPFLVL